MPRYNASDSNENLLNQRIFTYLQQKYLIYPVNEPRRTGTIT